MRGLSKNEVGSEFKKLVGSDQNKRSPVISVSSKIHEHDNSSLYDISGNDASHISQMILKNKTTRSNQLKFELSAAKDTSTTNINDSKVN